MKHPIYKVTKSLVTVAALALLMTFIAPASARADTLTFVFSTPTGVLGTSQNYTTGAPPITIAVLGFNGVGNTVPGTATALFGKNDAGDEKGVGINSGTHHEITTSNFVQINLNTWTGLNKSTLELQMGSVSQAEPCEDDQQGEHQGEHEDCEDDDQPKHTAGEEGESYKIYGSNVAGLRGDLLFSGTTENFFSVNAVGYQYISVQAASGDVLLRAARGTSVAAVPEPTTMVLLASGLSGLYLRRRRRQTLN